MINEGAVDRGSWIALRESCFVTRGSWAATAASVSDVNDHDSRSTNHEPRFASQFLLASDQMRRGFSILLVLFFGIGPLSALIDGSEDAGLPPCCRRHGAHHCAMYSQIMAMRGGSRVDPTPGISAPLTCPLYHGPAFSMLVPAHALTAAPARFRTEATLAFASPVEQSPAFSRPNLTHAGRGPPRTNPC